MRKKFTNLKRTFNILLCLRGLPSILLGVGLILEISVLEDRVLTVQQHLRLSKSESQSSSP